MTISNDSRPIQHPGADLTIEVSDPFFESDVRFATLYSPSLRGRGDISIFAPPELATSAPVPIVILLHGVYSSHWAWFLKGGAHRVARDLISAGELRPMLLVAPSDGLFEDGSWYLSHSGLNFEAWIINDVIEGILRLFPCADRKSPVFLAGLSMGGYGALRLGAKYPSRIRGISGHSAVTAVEEFSLFLQHPFPLDQIARPEADLLQWIHRNRSHLPAFRFDCGTEDPLIEGNRRFHRALQQQQIPHRYVEYPGEHNWHYWQVHIGASLLFFEELLRGTGSG